MTETQMLLLNMALYGGGLLFLIKKCGLISLPAVSMFLYFIASIFSYFYFISPFYWSSFASDEYVLLDGIIWNFAFNFLFAWMLRAFTFYDKGELIWYSETFVRKFQILLNIVFTISAIFILPQALSNLTGGDNLADLRDNTYETGQLVETNFLVNVLRRFFVEFTPFLIAIPVFNIIVRKKAGKIDWYSLVMFFTSIMSTMGAFISRSVIMSTIVYVMIVVVVLREFINLKVIKYSIFIGLPVVLILYGAFSAITAARFSNGVHDIEEAGANLRYLGESQVNFAALMYDKVDEPAYGFNTLTAFRRVAGLRYYGDAGADKDKNLEYLDNLHPYPNYIFYGCSGMAYMDWGPVAPLVVLGVINLLLMFKKRRKENFNFYKYLLSIVVGYYFIMGIFFTQFTSEAGNFLMLSMLILWPIMRMFPPEPLAEAEGSQEETTDDNSEEP